MGYWFFHEGFPNVEDSSDSYDVHHNYFLDDHAGQNTTLTTRPDNEIAMVNTDHNIMVALI